MKKLTAILGVLGLSAAAFADDLTIPNTFTAGTPARAADVNANFTAVEASVDDNAADISANAAAIQSNTSSIAVLTPDSGIPVYAQGVEIGRFISSVSDKVILMSSTGFVFQIGINLNPIWVSINYLQPSKIVYHSELNCSGRAFISQDSQWMNLLGTVFASDGTSAATAYYTQRGGSPVFADQVVQSFASNETCTNRTETLASVFEVFPNDEAITGVSNSPPLGPFVLGVP